MPQPDRLAELFTLYDHQAFTANALAQSLTTEIQHLGELAQTATSDQNRILEKMQELREQWLEKELEKQKLALCAAIPSHAHPIGYRGEVTNPTQPNLLGIVPLRDTYFLFVAEDASGKAEHQSKLWRDIWSGVGGGPFGLPTPGKGASFVIRLCDDHQIPGGYLDRYTLERLTPRDKSVDGRYFEPVVAKVRQRENGYETIQGTTVNYKDRPYVDHIYKNTHNAQIFRQLGIPDLPRFDVHPLIAAAYH